MMWGASVVWRSTFQKTVGLSSTEAEYVALSECVKEVVWLRLLLKELISELTDGTVIYEDNQGDMAKNVGYPSRTKHIDIRYHFIREKVATGEVKLKCVESKPSSQIFWQRVSQRRFSIPVTLLRSSVICLSAVTSPECLIRLRIEWMRCDCTLRSLVVQLRIEARA
ncbi:unnamed protein product [Phytophthora fragariaefolia]|uniref:Unnamed protein product n=1 Tax=Phytophthora fragariaefolia TaxID=1490495 RepID=A0A9W7CMG4_9STRA|nr:unnamed protein product [Phytophthora fragariaefolia]